MAYQIIEPLIDSTNIRALGVPLNSFNSLYLTTDQSFENLKTLLLTRTGERINQPRYGTDLLNVIFEPNTEELKSVIQDIITPPVNFWLPYITLEQIDVVTAEDDPTLNYNIQITISFSVGQYSTQTITFSATDEGVLEVE